MRILKKIIIFILALILTISILAYILIEVFYSSILNENYVLAKLEETDYYNKTYELVESNFENYIQQSGLDEEVIKNIITKEKVKKDTQNILNNIYCGLSEEISTDEIRNQLNKNIEDSLKDRKLTETEKDSIESFVDKICNEYKNTIIHTNYENQISNIYQKIINYIEIGKKILVLFMGSSAILIISINARKIYKSISALGVALVSSGAMFMMLNVYINTKIKIHTITLLNDIISTTLRDILQEILHKLNIYGLSLLLIGILAIILANLVHNLRKYGIKNEE